MYLSRNERDQMKLIMSNGNDIRISCDWSLIGDRKETNEPSNSHIGSENKRIAKGVRRIRNLSNFRFSFKLFSIQRVGDFNVTKHFCWY